MPSGPRTGRPDSGLTAAARDRIYGEGYYHGVNSGYPVEGYRSAHPDWEAWLDLIAMLAPPPGILFDSGTAFGYLPARAVARGYRVLGCDISSYALKQEPSCRGFLLRGDSEKLPVKSGTADIVCLFDLLEHLENPVDAIHEAARILKPGGLLVGATPDPLFFRQQEETHCHERCPSYWLHHLRRVGMKTVFRFSNIPENFQFVAAPRGSGTAAALGLFQHDYFSGDRDILELLGPESRSLSAVLREGWGTRNGSGRRIKGPSASIYLLNESETPIECRLRVEFDRDTPPLRLRLRLDGTVLDSFSVLPEDREPEIFTGIFSVPAGGHHLSLDLQSSPDQGPSVRSATLEALRKIPSEQHTAALPFDLYQRYRFAGEMIRILQPVSVLDAGGNLGDSGGHLAVSGDFFRNDGREVKIASTDIRHCDHPGHVPGNGLSLPFADRAFELVVSLDVLEHIPPEDRPRFLRELDRVASRWIILGAPFHSPEVEKAEASLVDDLGLHFLEEHSRFGLPAEEMITTCFSEEYGRHLLRFENGFLPHWGMMLPLTQLLFSIHNYQIYSAANRYYNEEYYTQDCRRPGYRTFFLISREPFPGREGEALKSLPGYSPAREAGPGPEPQAPRPLPFYNELLHLMETRSRDTADLHFLLAEREKYAAILLEQLRRYEKNPVLRMIGKMQKAVREDRQKPAGLK